MSAKILRKDDPNSARVSALGLTESESCENRGLQKLVLPDVSSLREVPTAGWKNTPARETPLNAQQEARQQAAAMIAEAEERSKLIENTSREKAEKEFQENVEAEVNARTSELRDNLASTLERLSGLNEEISKRVESDLVALALAISKKLIGREIATDREIVVTLLNKALAKLSDRTLAEVHLNPEDLTFIEANRESVLFRGSLELKPDPTISVGGCLIHTKKGDIDARIESQFEELSHGLIDV